MSTTRELLVTPLATVKTKRQRWAVRDLVPLSVATILAGRGGIGKSTILAWLTAGITQGTFDGDMQGDAAPVAFISGEDDLATTLVPRLNAAGADTARVFDLSGVRTVAEDGTTWTSLPTIASDMAALRHTIAELGIKVLIIDPVISVMDGDTIKATDVRRNLDPVASLAAELEIAVILVMHFGKGQGNASDKVSGSHAFRDIARSVLLLAVDEESDQRILTVDKSNYSQAAPSLAFSIDSVSVPTDEGDDATVGRAKLIGETQLTVHELVRRASDDNLGDLSVDILRFVNTRPEGVDTGDVVEEFDVQRNQARVYLGRLANSGRIQRIGRGRYAANATTATGVAPVASVTTVAFNPPNATLVTDATPATAPESLLRSPSFQDFDATNPLFGASPCRVCGTALHPSLTERGVHPHCAAKAAVA